MFLIKNGKKVLGRSGPVLGNLFMFTSTDKAAPHMKSGFELFEMEEEEK